VAAARRTHPGTRALSREVGSVLEFFGGAILGLAVAAGYLLREGALRRSDLTRAMETVRKAPQRR
jgi:hypothetical protein